jgi:hypothetical protein
LSSSATTWKGIRTFGTNNLTTAISGFDSVRRAQDSGEGGR